MHLAAPDRLTSITLAKSSSFKRIRSLSLVIPALLTNIDAAGSFKRFYRIRNGFFIGNIEADNLMIAGFERREYFFRGFSVVSVMDDHITVFRKRSGASGADSAGSTCYKRPSSCLFHIIHLNP